MAEANAAPAPLPGTIAYAEWKRKQGQKPENQETGNLGRKEVGMEASKEGNREDSQEASQETRSEVVSHPEKPVEEKPVFKASFLYTEEEIELFEDLKLEMRRKHGLRVTKNDLARAGIRFLADNYKKSQEKSFVVKAAQART